MSFLKGMLGGGSRAPQPPTTRSNPGAPATSPTAPTSFGSPVVVSSGFAPASLNPNIPQRPTPQNLAQARSARSAGLAGAVFGGPPATLAQHTVQPHASHPPHPQQPYAGQTYAQPPQQYQQQNAVGIPGGPPPSGGPSGGGDMFDMFGGLDVKAGDPLSGVMSDATTGGTEEPSGFSFLSDENDDIPNGIDNNIPAYDPAAAYNVPVPPVVVTPSPPVATADADRLHSTVSYLDRCLSIFWQEWRALIASQSQLKQEDTQLQLSVRRDTAAVKDTEEKQAAAVMAEEYEKADTYNAEMERLSHSIRSATDRLARTRSEIAQREGQKSASAQKILSILTDTTHTYEALNTNKQQELTVFLQTQISALTQKDKQVENDLDRVTASLSHTQKDLDHLSYEEETITRALTNETQPFIDEKNSLSSHEQTLIRELEELKRAIILKEKEIIDNRDKQHNADRAVDVIRVKYQQQRSSVAEKRHHVDMIRNKDVTEKRDIEYRAKMLQEEITRNKAAETAYREALYEIALQIAHIQYVATLITADEQHRQAYHTDYAADQQQISQLQYELNNYESHLATIRNELITVEQSVENHRQNIQNISTKIPSMEAEKNTAVSARDFKKAAAASKEIKTLQQSKTDSEAAIEELQKQVEKHKETLATADQKKVQIQRDIVRLEEVSDRKRLRYLLLTQTSLTHRQEHTTKVLQETYESQSASSSPSLHPAPLDHLQKEIESLDVELKWMEVEIRELRAKHQWSADVESIDASEEWDEVEEAVVVNHVNDPSPFDEIKSRGSSSTLSTSALQNGQSLGIPTINAPIRKSSSSSSSVSSSSSIASPRSRGKQKPTIEDLTALKAQLAAAEASLQSYEQKSAACIDEGDYDGAAELEDKIASEKSKVKKLETQVEAMQKELPEEITEKKEAEPPKSSGSPVSVEEDAFAEEL